MTMDAQQLRAIIDDALAAQRKPAAEVEIVVQKAITATLMSFGIRETDSDELQADFRHLRKWRKSVETAEGLTFKVVVGTLVSGTLAAFWMGFKVFVGKS